MCSDVPELLPNAQERLLRACVSVRMQKKSKRKQNACKPCTLYDRTGSGQHVSMVTNSRATSDVMGSKSSLTRFDQAEQANCSGCVRDSQPLS